MSDPHEDLIAELIIRCRTYANALAGENELKVGPNMCAALFADVAVALSDLQARVGEETAKRESVERERDAWREISSGHRDDANQFDGERQAAEARVGELEGALRSVIADAGDAFVFSRMIHHGLSEGDLLARQNDMAGKINAAQAILRGLVEVEGRSEEGGVTSVPPAEQNDVTDAASHTGTSRARLSRTAQEPPSPDNLKTGKEG